MPASKLELSVIICTRDRAASLAETLTCLTAGYQPELAVEVVVVDNGSKDDTARVVESFQSRLPIRFLVEPRTGKGHCLNRALDEGGLGEIIAGLDDDMSPEPGWFDAVLASCRRLPEIDVFGGNVYVIWPPGPVPEWAKACRGDVLGWGLSAIGTRSGLTKDRILRRDRGPWGNHFWFRAQLLRDHLRFGQLWVPEPALFLDFSESGSKAALCAGIEAGHRVQPALLDTEVQLERAEMIGRTFAALALRPYHHVSKSGSSFVRHPLLTRAYCLFKLLQYGIEKSRLNRPDLTGVRFVQRLNAIERHRFFRELIRIAGEDTPYGVFSSERRRLARELQTRSTNS